MFILKRNSILSFSSSENNFPHSSFVKQVIICSKLKKGKGVVFIYSPMKRGRKEHQEYLGTLPALFTSFSGLITSESTIIIMIIIAVVVIILMSIIEEW